MMIFGQERIESVLLLKGKPRAVAGDSRWLRVLVLFPREFASGCAPVCAAICDCLEPQHVVNIFCAGEAGLVRLRR